jgi:hypothetical protein
MVRDSVKFLLKTAGLLPVVRRLVKFFSSYPRHLVYVQRFRAFKRQYGPVLRQRLHNPSRPQKVALLASPYYPEVVIELGLIKALELANFMPVVLVPRSARGRLVARYYALVSVKEIHCWEDFVAQVDVTAAEGVIDQCQSTQELLAYEYGGVRVGRLAVSSALRSRRSGSLDLQSAEERQFLVGYVAAGMAYAKAAQNIVRQFHPDLALFVDTVYTPAGELFDYCLAHHIDTIQWQAAHKSNALILKRYTLKTRHEHPRSLSPTSWRGIRDMPWTAAHREQLHQELYGNYVSGDWYSVVSTQFNKRLMAGGQIRDQLGLHPAKKTAFIFPHILWDATLFWGKCLFRDFQEWLIETVRMACANDQVNWVIKIHPANRRVRDGFRGEPAEVAVLRTHIGPLPSHVFMIPADSDVSTFSLFDLMDYCLTIYGTVGIEAARLGIPVLTGGWGIYDHKGFTIDSESRQQYLERLTHIQDIPRLTTAQQEVAERFAYGVFLLRPFLLQSVTLKYQNNAKKFSTQGQVNIQATDAWYTAADLRAFAEWVADAEQEDFLTPLAQ